MPEIEQPMTVVQLHYQCDECGSGEYKATGVALLSSPPKYPHACDKCGHEQTFKVSYPSIAFRPLATEKAADEEAQPQ